ncbi:MAG: TraB/GumN family protein [Bacteroidota bacterium]
MKYISLLFSLLFSTLGGTAQVSPTADSLAQAGADNPENSLLWEISGRDLSEPSYLYGTIHMIGNDDFFLTKATEKAFDRSERVAFEIDLKEMNNLGTMLSLIGSSMMDGGTRLRDLLSEEDYKMVDAHFQKVGMPLMLFERVKPMFLSAMSAGEGGGLQSGKVKSYEMEFMKMAETDQLETAGLETIEYQMSIFDSIPYPVQAEMLVESIRSEENTDSDQFAEMVRLYKAQDLEGMQAMFEDEEGGLGEYEDVMLNNRNRNWIPVMEKMMREKVTFFAVGAGHLGGDAGVVALLRAEGYTLRPLREWPEE